VSVTIEKLQEEDKPQVMALLEQANMHYIPSPEMPHSLKPYPGLIVKAVMGVTRLLAITACQRPVFCLMTCRRKQRRSFPAVLMCPQQFDRPVCIQ
jgi:hypothetical protein